MIVGAADDPATALAAVLHDSLTAVRQLVAPRVSSPWKNITVQRSGGAFYSPMAMDMSFEPEPEDEIIVLSPAPCPAMYYARGEVFESWRVDCSGCAVFSSCLGRPYPASDAGPCLPCRIHQLQVIRVPPYGPADEGLSQPVVQPALLSRLKEEQESHVACLAAYRNWSSTAGRRAKLIEIHLPQAWYVFQPRVTSILRSPSSDSSNVSVAPPQRMLNDHQRAIREALLEQGLSECAIDELLRSRWAEGTQSNLASAWGQWAKFCVRREAAGRPVSLLDPSPVELVDFLSEIRSGIRREGKNQSVKTKAAWVRGVRSAVSATVALWSKHAALGAHPLVSGYITALKNEDFHVLKKRGYRYDDTWDAELVFTHVTEHHVVYDILDSAMPDFVKAVHAERDLCIAAGRLLLASRSHDLTCIFRGVRSEHDCLRFWLSPAAEVHCPLALLRSGVKSIGGAPSPPSGSPSGPFGVLGVSVRYFGPKQRHSLEVRSHGYTDWITVDSVPELSACWASALYWYVRATELMSLADDCLFCSSRGRHDKAGGKCTGLHSESVANAMRRIMTKAGIPEEYRAHSGRHAGLAYHKSKGLSDEDVMARANMSCRTYRTHYARQVRRQGYVPPPVEGAFAGYAPPARSAVP